MRILAIGNSFSVDALHYFKFLADADGVATETLDLYIGGCSLKLHAENIQNQAKNYICYLDGSETDRMVSIQEALQENTWDVVIIQQASQDSGCKDTYEPYGSKVIDIVRQYAPNAEIWFHNTWAYEHNSDHPGFPRYECDQAQMHASINHAVDIFIGRHDLPVIPSGDVIQVLRQQPYFDYKNGGESLCRDSYHLSFDYGRYAVAATWYEMLLKSDVRVNTFVPQDAKPKVIDMIQRIVHKVCETEKQKYANRK